MPSTRNGISRELIASQWEEMLRTFRNNPYQPVPLGYSQQGQFTFSAPQHQPIRIVTDFMSSDNHPVILGPEEGISFNVESKQTLSPFQKWEELNKLTDLK